MVYLHFLSHDGLSCDRLHVCGLLDECEELYIECEEKSFKIFVNPTYPPLKGREMEKIEAKITPQKNTVSFIDDN